MKHLRQPLILLIFCCLILPSGVLKKVRAQNSPGDGKKVFDNYTTVTTMVYPPAGAAFKVAKEMLDLFGYFGNSVDVVGEAIQRINERLDILERRVTDLEARVRAVENGLFQTQNLSRVRLLKEKQRKLQLLLYKLRQKPTERREKLALAKEAEIIAGGFLDDPDLWLWSDMREKDGNMLPADFKPLPALEYYVVALVAWMAAIDYATDGDYGFVKREYGRELQKHIDRLRVRPGWKEGDEAITLPENVKQRISCTMAPSQFTPRPGVCSIYEGCEDQLARVFTTVRIHEVPLPRGTELCNVPPTMSARGSEDELEQLYGTEVFEKLAEKLELIKTRGTAREDYAGTFDPSTQTAHFLYAMKPDGHLLWYRHRAISRKTGLPSPGTQGTDSTDRATESGGVMATQPQVAGSGAAGQDPRIRKPTEHETFAKFEVTHALEGPKHVGSEWTQFKRIIPGGNDIVYVVAQDNRLKWIRHIDYANGVKAWEGPRDVGGPGWGEYKHIFSGGNGILYFVSHEDNRLKWVRHIDYANGVKAWEGPKDVGGPGWGEYKHVFSTGGGVIYAVTDEGKLLWQREIDYMQGVKNWEGPKEVGTGWQKFKAVFSAGEGVIYGLTEDGQLLWHKHEGYKDGSMSWRGPVAIAADWNDFLFIFPSLTGTWVPPVVR